MADVENGPECPVCSEKFNEVNAAPMSLLCGHSLCYNCHNQFIQRNEYSCPTCRTPFKQVSKNFALIEGLSAIEKLENEKAGLSSELEQALQRVDQELINVDTKDIEILTLEERIETKNREILMRIKEYEELQEVRAKELSVVKQCSECDNKDNESNLNICNTCFVDLFNRPIEEIDFEKNDVGVKLEELTICSTCAIRKHLRKNHEISDFFPIFSANQFRKHNNDVSLRRKCYDISTEQQKGTMTSILRKLEEGSNQLERFIDLLRRSKSTEAQNQIALRAKDVMDIMESMIKVNSEENIRWTDDFSNMLYKNQKEIDQIERDSCLEGDRLVPITTKLVTVRDVEPQNVELEV